MKTKEFITALRKVIREEVRSAVRQEIKDILVESVHRAADIKPIVQERVVQKQVQPTQQKAAKKYTGNPVLDQVLSETTLTSDFRSSTNVGYDDYQDFGTFTADQVQPSAMPSMMDMDVADDIGGDLNVPVPASSQMPFMKDYSQLLKKADQISAQKQF